MSIEIKMNRLKSDDILTLISTSGLLIWVSTGFFEGMFSSLVSYWMLIIPCIIMYLYVVIGTLSSFFKNGLQGNLIKLFSLCILVLSGITLQLNNSELFKSEIIIKSILRDDLSNSILTFRKNGKCENKLVGMFGMSKKYHGNYILKGDTIVFLSKPYDNVFLPDTLLLDTEKEAIFIERDKCGNFRTKKEWLNHYKIEK